MKKVKNWFDEKTRGVFPKTTLSMRTARLTFEYIFFILTGFYAVIYFGAELIYPMIREDVIAKSGWPYYPMYEPNIGTIRHYYGDLGWVIRDLYDLIHFNFTFIFVLGCLITFCARILVMRQSERRR